MTAGEPPMRMQELMRRFLEVAHDLSGPEHLEESLSMQRVCEEIGLRSDDFRCQMIMGAHVRIGNLAMTTDTSRPNEPGWFRITPQGIEMARRWRS